MQLSAADFKRKYMNKAAQKRATISVVIRATVGSSNEVGIKKASKRLRETWDKRSTSPADFHKPSKPHAGRIVPRHEWPV